MAKSKKIIEVNNLIKAFGSFKALNGLNLEVTEGEVHGFLGPNGSGKSTTIRILLGLLKKTSGDVSLLGKDPWKEATTLHRHLSYVPGDVNLWPNLTGGECIDLLADLRGGIDEAKRQELIEVFKIDPRKKFRTYSKGNRQKVALVAALASDVELYILDEPTSGLDPLMESVFQQHIRKLKKQNKSILLSSHILSEVEALCDRVTIISEGKTVDTGALKNLQKVQHTYFEIETSRPTASLEKVKGIVNFEQKNKLTTFEVEPGQLESAMKEISKLDVQHVVSHPPKLEELFLKHYDKQEEKQKVN